MRRCGFQLTISYCRIELNRKHKYPPTTAHRISNGERKRNIVHLKSVGAKGDSTATMSSVCIKWRIGTTWSSWTTTHPRVLAPRTRPTVHTTLSLTHTSTITHTHAHRDARTQSRAQYDLRQKQKSPPPLPHQSRTPLVHENLALQITSREIYSCEH